MESYKLRVSAELITVIFMSSQKSGQWIITIIVVGKMRFLTFAGVVKYTLRCSQNLKESV